MKPIIFKTDEVRAILEGRKSQTRRVAKYITDYCISDERINAHIKTKTKNSYFTGCIKHFNEMYAPYQVDDVLWVRETWQLLPSGFDEIPPEKNYIYKATDELSDECTRWRRSIHMPREAARLFLKVTGVRVERVQNMNFYDWKADFCPSFNEQEKALASFTGHTYVVELMKNLWDGIYSTKGYSWDTNPWVFVIEFERVKNP